MAKAGARMTGGDALRRKIANVKKKLPGEVERALYIETEIEGKEVKRRTPVDTGELRASVMVLGPFREGRAIWTMIVAGGPAAPYALIVHEDLEAFHQVGQAKYLESVILESRPHMAQRVANRISLKRASS